MGNASITKTCANCGLTKPLSAFLQLAEGGGTLYGNICATCRSAQKDAPKQKESGDSTTTHTDKELDSKAKVKLEEEKRQLRHEMEERNQEEAQEKEELLTKQTQKTETITTQQKIHRQSFLETRKVVDKKNIPASTVNTPEDIASREASPDSATLSTDTQIIKPNRAASPLANAFKTWLGAEAPIVSATEKAAKRRFIGAHRDKAVDKTQENLVDHAKNQRKGR